MDAAELQGGGVTIDGARRFGSALAEVPVWAASRAVCEMGTAEIVGGLVLTPVRSPSDRAQRIGWWLIPRLRDRHPELLEAVIERLRSTGTVTAVMHLRTDASDAITAAEHTGFVRGHALEHTIGDGRSADFWEYARPIAG